MSQLTARVPVGFRFHPTDEELVGYYLPKKVKARKIDLDLIREVDLYKLEPWDLEELCKIQADSTEKQSDCYFFSRKDKKYPTGNRANRATTRGFWKATGRDKPISSKLHTLIGMRKTLVFYEGRAPHGVKTDWIMHEFRLDDGPGRPAHEDGGWVVCRVFKKNKNLKMKMQERSVSFEEQMGLLPEDGPPEILSHRFPMPFPDSQYGAKHEVINLDEYTHHGQYLNNSGAIYTKPENYNHSMLSSARSFQGSFRRAPVEDYLNIPESPASYQFGNNEATTSDGSDGDESILGLENVDWSALLTDQPSTKGKMLANDPLVQIKRQNSDLFPSQDLWNYSQVVQQL